MLRITINGDSEGLVRRLRQGIDTQGVLQGFAVHRTRRLRRQFDTETDPDGNRWPPISEVYRQRKRQQGYSTKVWTRTGDTRDSIGYRIRKNRVDLGVRTAYAPYAHKKRPLLESRRLSRVDEKWIERAIAKQISRMVRGD